MARNKVKSLIGFSAHIAEAQFDALGCLSKASADYCFTGGTLLNHGTIAPFITKHAASPFAEPPRLVSPMAPRAAHAVDMMTRGNASHRYILLYSSANSVGDTAKGDVEQILKLPGTVSISESVSSAEGREPRGMLAEIG
jgi:hypothetical protein